MRARACMLLAILWLTLPAAAAEVPERYVELEISDRAELETLTRVLSVDRVEGSTVRAYALPDQLEALRSLGYSWRVLPLPGRQPGARMGLVKRITLGQWDAYPTYAEYVQLMEGFAADFPHLCRLHEIGDSTNLVRPHELLAVKISDNPELDEDEPEVFLTSTMHGDETVGYVLMLRLIDELLRHHEPEPSDPDARRLTALVDELEIWINPLANPDGTYFGSDDSVAGARRYFANPDGTASGVDPNRNFPDPDEGDHPDGHPWWRETEAMTAFASEHRLVLSANLHGGAEVVNYPWDTWQRRHTDDTWFIALARAFADQAQAAARAEPYRDSDYMTFRDDGITNGWDWYPVAGGRQDFMTFWHGSRETTIELSDTKNPPAATLPMYWDYNRNALLGYLEAALRGVRGLVTDAAGSPISATVEVAWHDNPADNPYALTDPSVGDYHRLLSPGSYWLVYRAAGFVSDVRQVEVGRGPATRADVVLAPDHGLSTSLVGTVSSVNSGLPLANATVRLLGPLPSTEITGADGAWAFHALAEDAYLIEVVAPGHAAQRAAVQARHPETRLDLELVRQVVIAPGSARSGMRRTSGRLGPRAP